MNKYNIPILSQPHTFSYYIKKHKQSIFDNIRPLPNRKSQTIKLNTTSYDYIKPKINNKETNL